MASKPLVIVHGWSDSAESFRGLARFFSEAGREATVISLGDWLSLDDEVTYLDLAYAMRSAWRDRKLPGYRRSVDVVVHSTGALLVRQWLQLFYSADNNPVDHLLMLAPASYGSPLAHKGKAFYGRIIKGWWMGFQTGTKLLNGLELGSPYTWKLAMGDVLSRSYWYGRNRIKATVLVGNQGYGGVRADDNEPKSPRARELFLGAVSVAPEGWGDWCRELARLRREVEDRATPRRDPEHHLYQNTVVRVLDDVGNPVPDYFVEFFEHDSDTSALGRFFHRDVLRKVHRPAKGEHYRSMYVDATLLHHRIDKQDFDLLEIAISAEPRFDAERHGVGYQQEAGSAKLTPEDCRRLFEPNATLLVDVRISRQMEGVFRFVGVGDS